MSPIRQSLIDGSLRVGRLASCLLISLSSLASLAEADSIGLGFLGSSACAGCHAQIYESYLATPMGRSSGTSGSGEFQERMNSNEFFHSLSGVRYRVLKEQGGLRLIFSQRHAKEEREVSGSQRLAYFIGSGSVGRSYLFSIDGFLFQAPVSYYARSAKWDLAPGYQQYDDLFLMRPVEPECLECHASGVQRISGTQNGYLATPFREGSISCERCHGPGKVHVDQMDSGQPKRLDDIVNPAKLEVRRRDSVCGQCHLLGEARIAKAGRSLSSFAAGEELSDYAVSFVRKSKTAVGLKATSHYEKLWQSRCKQASGDRLWCGTCHSIHSRPSPTLSGDFFRSRCLSCHQSSDCREQISQRESQADLCTSCHMPKAQSLEAEHSVFTDHAIPRRALSEAISPAQTSGSELVEFWGGKVEPREQGLAYAQLGLRLKVSGQVARAVQLLKTAETQGRADSVVFQQLGYISDQLGRSEEAIGYYQKARQEDTSQTAATVNLANHLAMKGKTVEAVALWEEALSKNPGLESARINMALAFLQQGDSRNAERVLKKALELNPALKSARRLLVDPRMNKVSP